MNVCSQEEMHAVQFFELLLLVLVALLLAAEVLFFKHQLWIPENRRLRLLQKEEEASAHPVQVFSNPSQALSGQGKEEGTAEGTMGGTAGGGLDIQRIEEEAERNLEKEDGQRVQRFFSMYRRIWQVFEDYTVEWAGPILMMVALNSTTIITLVIFFFLVVALNYARASTRLRPGLWELCYLPLLLLLYVQGWADNEYSNY